MVLRGGESRWRGGYFAHFNGAFMLVVYEWMGRDDSERAERGKEVSVLHIDKLGC